MGGRDFTGGSFTRDFGVKVSNADRCSLANTTSTVFCTADGTTFATGSKDTLDITGWQCNKDNNVNSKIDIMNAYAAQYRATQRRQAPVLRPKKNEDNDTRQSRVLVPAGWRELCVSRRERGLDRDAHQRRPVGRR